MRWLHLSRLRCCRFIPTGLHGSGFIPTRLPHGCLAVLRRQNSYKLSLFMLPLFTLLTVYISCYYIIQKGPKLADKVSDSTNAWISACFGEGRHRAAASHDVFAMLPRGA